MQHTIMATAKQLSFLQRAVGASADGLIGPRTLAAVAAMDKNDVVFLFNAERIEFYTGLRGWISFGKGIGEAMAGNNYDESYGRL